MTDLKLEFDENQEIVSTDVKKVVNSDEIDLMEDDLEDDDSSDEEDDRGVAEGEISDDDDGDLMNNRLPPAN